MHSDDNHYCVIPGDLCKSTLKCVHCDTSITLPGTIGETLYHAPIAILRHWEMIDHQDHPTVIFSGMDTFGIAQASFLETLTNIDDIDLDRIICSRVTEILTPFFLRYGAKAFVCIIPHRSIILKNKQRTLN